VVLNISDVFEGRRPPPVASSPYFRVAAPLPPLRPFVECLWIRAIAGADPRNDRRILPDGRMDVVWIPGLGVLVAGPQSRYTVRPNRFPFLAIGERFHPGGAPSLLGLPASDFVDGHVPLEAIDRRLAHRLDARLEGARAHAEAFAAFNAELLRRLEGFGAPDAAVQAGVRMLDNGSLTVAELAAQLFVSVPLAKGLRAGGATREAARRPCPADPRASDPARDEAVQSHRDVEPELSHGSSSCERQLRRRFDERVGYGPKTLAANLRFQRLVAELRSARLELAAAAAAAGYADQAHLSRESLRLAGLSPRELAD